MSALVVVAVSLVLIFAATKLLKKAGELEAQAHNEAEKRARLERMAAEMLKERSREDVARDLDSGTF